MNIIKMIWGWFCAAVVTTLLFLPMTIAALLSSTGNLAFNISKLWARITLMMTGVHCVIRGREKIQPGQAYVVISNHQSIYDIVAIEVVIGDPVDTAAYTRDNVEHLIQKTRDVIVTNFNPAYPQERPS